MSVGEKAKAEAQRAKGKVKESVGHATGNKRLAAAGKKDQVVGTVKDKTATAKKALKQGTHGAAGGLKEAAGKATGNQSLRSKGKAETTVAKLKRKINK